MNNEQPKQPPRDIQQEIISRNAQHRQAVASRIQDAIFDGLVTKYEREKNLLPEHIFVRDFLPYFCGELKIDDNPQLIPMWCTVAGNPSNEVTILSSTGEKLFDVPPIMDSSVFNPTYNHRRGDRKESIEDISSQAELLSQSLPERGERYFNEAFYYRAQMLRNQNFDNSPISQRWMAIFERYGKVKKDQTNLQSDGTPKPAAKSTISDDDLEFEWNSE